VESWRHASGITPAAEDLVGRAGGNAARLDSWRQARLRDLCREMLPEAPFVVSAWAARDLA